MIASKRILIVDDDAGVLFVFRETLRALGEMNEIVTAQNGSEALEEFKKKPFDLVVTDLEMPDMRGVQLTEAIKNLNPETSVIWITAYGAYRFLSDAKRLGVRDCRDKPLEVPQILDLVKDALSDD